ncbi:hypothetical protein K474DRAFT_1653669 [Panus rudis PR-1116 ss-1]|nr:hypothetical protein K474DRAFT_1653669 [Panus rudis PR-1116 ss-1]
MPPFIPTLREIALLAILLTLLLTGSSKFKSSNINVADLTKIHSGATVVEDATGVSSPTFEHEFVLQQLSRPLKWGMGQVPETDIIAHVPGWTIFDRLYILNGTVYIVTDHPELVPDRALMTSKSIVIKNGPEEELKRRPTDKEMRIISTDEARQLFGTQAERLDGVSWLVNDPKEFVTHYYHWSAELFFGLWRTYSSLDPSIPATGSTSLPIPRRMMFTHIDANNWRDYASMNQFVLFSVFPSITMEFWNDWNERAAMGRPFVFDRVLFADRAAAMHGTNFLKTQRTAANAFALPGSVHWWQPIRNNVVNFAGLQDEEAQIALKDESAQSAPVITYVSRQEWGRRMLIQEHHEKLVSELYKLRDKYGYEVNVVSMDRLTRQEQIRLAARTTIMMGVHGNGLTSLLWMKPSPKSTVMEFFFPGGFAHDYEYTTRALGMVHYGFWGSQAFTRPDVPPVAYPEGFQGNNIPIDGELVARIVHERLTLQEEADD